MIIVLYAFLGLLAIVLLIALAVKKEYSISAEIVIDRPSDAVFNYIIHLRNQEKYSKWVMADPNAKLVYKGVDGTKGFIASWNSEDKNVGVGEQEITKIIPGEGYEVEIRFEKPFKGISQAQTMAKAISSSQTKVKTNFDTKTPFPMSIMIPVIKKMLLKDMNLNMTNLKRVLESQ